MNEELRLRFKELRKMGSKDAADWLIRHYPIDHGSYGVAFTLISHLSWKKADQLRLAHYYLSKIHRGSSKPYEVFASIIPIYKLVDVLKERVPSEQVDRDLLWYYVGPTLTRSAKTSRDLEAIQSLIYKLGIS